MKKFGRVWQCHMLVSWTRIWTACVLLIAVTLLSKHRWLQCTRVMSHETQLHNSARRFNVFIFFNDIGYYTKTNFLYFFLGTFIVLVFRVCFSSLLSYVIYGRENSRHVCLRSSNAAQTNRNPMRNVFI